MSTASTPCDPTDAADPGPPRDRGDSAGSDPGAVVVIEHTVDPTEVDEAGHLNLRRYAELIEEGVHRSIAADVVAGIGPIPIGGWYIEECFIRHLREQFLSSALQVSVCPLDGSGSSRPVEEVPVARAVRLLVEITGGGADVAAAAVVAVRIEGPGDTGLLRRPGRRSVLAAMGFDGAPVHARPRTLEVGHIPELAVADLRSRTWQRWFEWTIDAEACDDEGWFVAGPLVLARGPRDPGVGIIEARRDLAPVFVYDVGGVTYALSNSETRRLQVATPRVGAAVRSIGGNIAIADKYRIRREWTVDADSGETYAMCDSVDLCVNLDERRVMAFPPPVRADLERYAHLDLAGFEA